MFCFFPLAPVVDAGAVEYVEYTFPYFDIDPGQELWNNKPSYEQDVRWLESYSELETRTQSLVFCGFRLTEERR